MLVRSKISQESNGRGDVSREAGRKSLEDPQDMFAYLLLFYRFCVAGFAKFQEN